MKKLFDMGIGFDEETGQYCAIVNSLTDRKTVTLADQNIRVVMSKLSRRIRQKAKDIKLFPLSHDQRSNGHVEFIPPFRVSGNEAFGHNP